MKILSISDVITNSSSEVFCYITADLEVLKEIYNFLGEGFLESDNGEGGIYFDDYSISISIAYECWMEGLDKILSLGLEKLLEPWKDKYKIHYEDY